MNIDSMADDELLSRVRSIHGDMLRLDATLIGYLAEVEERRLHLKAACSSMFAFCMRRLGMSEGAAFRRMNAARMSRRFPKLLALIENGQLHASNLVLLRDHLTEANFDELTTAAAGKSKRELELIIAIRAPRPDVPSMIRQLPTSPPAAPAPSLAFAPATDPLRAVPLSAETSQWPTIARRPPSTPTRVEPLSAERFKVQFTASSELRAKLERAKALMAHRNPTGDLEPVIGRALDLLLAQLTKERLGAASALKASKSVPAAAMTPRAPSASKVTRRIRGAPSAPNTSKATRRIPAAVRREVFARDGEQCTFQATDGHRCAETSFLELDHIQPRAKGGADTASNLRVVCRAHNSFFAEIAFGRGHMEAAIGFRQRKRSRPARAHESVGSSASSS